MLNSLPIERTATKRGLRYRAELTGLAMALTCGLLSAQVPVPELQVAASSAASNVTLRISSRPGWFYTLQRSADLANWSPITTLFANSDVLTWSDSFAVVPMAGFFRAKINSPNQAVTANYNGWTNAVLLNNGLVEAAIVPDAGRVLQFRFLGTTNGPFWENLTMSGRTATPSIWNTEGAFGATRPGPRRNRPGDGRRPPGLMVRPIKLGSPMESSR